MAVLLGGDKSWKQRVFGDVVISYQWVNGEPAMILYPKIKRTGQQGAFVLCLSAAHQYAFSDGYPNVDHLIPQSINAARVMGMDNTTQTIRRIADAIMDGLEDLVKMPPEPVGLSSEQHGQEIGEASITVDGKEILSTSLKDLSMQEMAANGIH